MGVTMWGRTVSPGWTEHHQQKGRGEKHIWADGGTGGLFKNAESDLEHGDEVLPGQRLLVIGTKADQEGGFDLVAPLS